jgi:serine/threonine protein kinase
MDHYEGGDLLSLILDGVTCSKRECIRLFRQIALGLQCVHSQGLAHGDLKRDNIVIDASGNLRLIDFGYAKRRCIGCNGDKSGTLMYAAPELVRPGRYHTQKADIWALGIILFGMATGKFPFPNNSTMATVAAIRCGRLNYPQVIDAEIERMIRKLTALNPNQRPTIDEVLDDPIFGAEVDKPNRHIADTRLEEEMERNIWEFA